MSCKNDESKYLKLLNAIFKLPLVIRSILIHDLLNEISMESDVCKPLSLYLIIDKNQRDQLESIRLKFASLLPKPFSKLGININFKDDEFIMKVFDDLDEASRLRLKEPSSKRPIFCNHVHEFVKELAKAIFHDENTSLFAYAKVLPFLGLFDLVANPNGDWQNPLSFTNINFGIEFVKHTAFSSIYSQLFQYLLLFRDENVSERGTPTSVKIDVDVVAHTYKMTPAYIFSSLLIRRDLLSDEIITSISTEMEKVLNCYSELLTQPRNLLANFLIDAQRNKCLENVFNYRGKVIEKECRDVAENVKKCLCRDRTRCVYEDEFLCRVIPFLIHFRDLIENLCKSDRCVNKIEEDLKGNVNNVVASIIALNSASVSFYAIPSVSIRLEVLGSEYEEYESSYKSFSFDELDMVIIGFEPESLNPILRFVEVTLSRDFNERKKQQLDKLKKLNMMCDDLAASRLGWGFCKAYFVAPCDETRQDDVDGDTFICLEDLFSPLFIARIL